MKVYSSNEEAYNSHTPEEAAEDCIDENSKAGDVVTVFEGETREFDHLRFIDGACIVDVIQSSAYDDGGEYSDGYLDDLTKDDYQELERLIAKWLDGKAEKPTFYAVENVREVKVVITEDMI